MRSIFIKGKGIYYTVEGEAVLPVIERGRWFPIEFSNQLVPKLKL